VAGSVAEDGAPTVAANVAVEAARSGRRVVLVDLDVERPTLRRRFALRRHAGLSGVLSGEHDLDSALDQVHTGQGVLEVLTAGSSPRPIDARRLAKVVPALRARADLTLLLSPPLLETKRAREFAHQCEGLVLVLHLAKGRRSRRPQLDHLLGGLDTPALGFILAGATTGAPRGAGLSAERA
jgi:Mrp family chromosome partitioning ATPase